MASRRYPEGPEGAARKGRGRPAEVPRTDLPKKYPGADGRVGVPPVVGRAVPQGKDVPRRVPECRGNHTHPT